MKGIQNRQKMVVTPREHIGKKTLSTQKNRIKEMMQRAKSGTLKSGFRKARF